MAAQPSGVSTTPPSFLPSANLLSPFIQVIDENVEEDWAQY